MAVTATLQGVGTTPGAFTSKNFTMTLDSSYPNPAGYVLTPTTFGFNTLRKVIFAGAGNVAAGAYEPVLIQTFDSTILATITSVALHMIVGSTGVEVANAVSLATVVLNFVVEGN